MLDFLKSIWDFVLNLVEGIATLANALLSTSTLLASTSSWMPGFLFAFMTSALALIIMLRIVGR